MVIQNTTRRQAILLASLPLIALYIVFTLKLHELVPSIATWPTLTGLARHKLWLWTTKKSQHHSPHTHGHDQEYARLSTAGLTKRKSFSRHIVAVGDLHGDMPNARRVLRFAGVVNAHGDWSGDVDFFVQTGDIIDRGDDTILLFIWMERLRDQAQRVGGTVLSHLGNHEWMNALGDWRYVYPSELKTFGSIVARQRMITIGRIGRAWATNYTTASRLPLHPSMGPPNTPYPPHSPISSGMHMQKDEEEFHWLHGHGHDSSEPASGHHLESTHEFDHKHGHEKADPLSHSAYSFVHGGLSPTYHELTPFPSRINALSHSLLAKVQNRPQPPPHPPNPYHGLPQSATEEEKRLYDANGPLWYRGWATESEKVVCSKVDEVLRKTGTRRMIMGHTPDFHNIKSRCNGKIIIIDTGISHAYGGILSALSIHYTLTPIGSDDSRRWKEREIVSAVYPDRRQIIAESEREVVGDYELWHEKH